jgi:hypothetical protein
MSKESRRKTASLIGAVGCTSSRALSSARIPAQSLNETNRFDISRRKLRASALRANDDVAVRVMIYVDAFSPIAYYSNK